MAQVSVSNVTMKQTHGDRWFQRGVKQVVRGLPLNCDDVPMKHHIMYEWGRQMAVVAKSQGKDPTIMLRKWGPTAEQMMTDALLYAI